MGNLKPCWSCLSPKLVVGVKPFLCWSIGPVCSLAFPRMWWEYLCVHRVQEFRRLRDALMEIILRFCHYFVTAAINWLVWRKVYSLASHSVFLLNIAYRPGLTVLTLPSLTALSLWMMFGQRQLRSSCRYNIENGIKGERMQARSQSLNPLDHHVPKSKCLQTSSAVPLPKKWASNL